MSKTKFKLPKASCKYGAPMGRPSWPRTDAGTFDVKAKVFDKKASCFRLPFCSGDYDTGGAYWGGPATVYCATNGFDDDDNTFQLFTRATSRADAVRKFDEMSQNKITWFRRPHAKVPN